MDAVASYVRKKVAQRRILFLGAALSLLTMIAVFFALSAPDDRTTTPDSYPAVTHDEMGAFSASDAFESYFSLILPPKD